MHVLKQDAGHLFGADVLRGVAILMVVIYHAVVGRYGFGLPWAGYWRDFHALQNGWHMALYPASFGWAGVSLFFVLSGFCIHWSFLRSPRFSTRQFLWHRFWRIYPAYLVALVAFFWLGRLDLASASGAKMFLSHALLVHNFHPASLYAINPSFWSIATEVQLYLLFPVLLLMRRRFGMETCLLVTFGVGLVWRVMAVALWGLPEEVITAAFASPLVTWFDWTLGAYVAERVFKQETAFKRHLTWLMALVPAFLFSTLFKPLATCSFTLAAGISAVVLDLMASVPSRRNIFLSGLAFIGMISYSLYLWHQPLLGRLAWKFGQFLPSSTVGVAVAVALGVLAYFSYRFIERKSINLGKKLWSRIATQPKDGAGNEASVVTRQPVETRAVSERPT